MDPLDPLWDRPKPKLHWAPDLHKPFVWLVDHTDIFGLVELVSIQSHCLLIPQRPNYFLFPSTQSLVKGCRSLWEGWDRDFCQCTKSLPSSKGSGLTLVQGVLGVWELALVWRLVEEPWLFLWFKLDFCSLDLELFHWYRWSNNWVGLLSISFLGIPWATNQCHRSLLVRLF